MENLENANRKETSSAIDDGATEVMESDEMPKPAQDLHSDLKNQSGQESTPIQTLETVLSDEPDAPALIKKIGKTTYIARIHFSEDATETMEEKIKRMLKEEVRELP